MSNKSMGKPLTMDLVFTKTKSDSLQNIKNLNLWGNDLEDLKLLQKMPNLEVISLSVNKINSLKDFASCKKLQELYLRKNNICDINEIRHLLKLPSLKVLWLHDNPCSQVKDYREIVIKALPNLVKLDNSPITPQQRMSTQNVNDQVYENETEPPYQQVDARPQSNHSNMSNMQRNSQKQRNSHNNSQAYYEEQREFSQQDKWQKKAPPVRQRKQENLPKEEDITRNQNVLMAILSLMRELDPGSLQIVRRQADKMLQ